jgi:GntR family transcriptional regulator/MocR family aminotransferase
MEPLFELKITTADKGSREVTSHLFRQLKDAILDRRLPPGSRLPSTRGAPRAFGVSRNTAQDVYDRLAQDGLLVAKHGSGTYVRELRQIGEPSPVRAEEVQNGRVNGFWEQPDIASWIGFWHERQGVVGSPKVIADLRPALVDQRLFPHASFRQVMARQLRRLETNPSSSRSPQRNQGNSQLRRAIAEHIGQTRAVACKSDEVLVTSGAQQAFDLIARALVERGETVVAVEDPGYPPMRVPFAAAGAVGIVPVRVDGEGIVVDEIPADAKIVCVCPSHQFPLGMAMSPARREALLRFARQNGAAIVEDDYDGEFRYDGSPLEALRGNGSASRVFYVGSFSKCMFPAIRLGFIVSPAWALPALVAAKNATDWHSSIPVQAAVAGFIHDGHLTRHIRRMRRIYRDRRDRVVALLQQRLGGALALVPSFYGMHVSAVASEPLDCESVSEELARRGVMIHTLARYFLGPQTCSGFILGYAAATFEELELGVDALSEELARQSVRKPEILKPRKSPPSS